jgi:hypothetical protein
MKVLLRKTKDSRYYAGKNEWTADSRDARDFDQVDQAIQFRHEEQLTDVEVVLRYDDPFCDLVLPLGSPC